MLISVGNCRHPV